MASTFSEFFCSAYTVPAAPSGLAVAPGDGDAFLTWNPVAGASSYNVYENAGTGYALLGSTAANGYTAGGLTDGSTYNFEVSAVVGGGEGAPSSAVGVTPAAATIQDLSASAASTSEIDLSWDPIASVRKRGHKPFL